MQHGVRASIVEGWVHEKICGLVERHDVLDVLVVSDCVSQFGGEAFGESLDLGTRDPQVCPGSIVDLRNKTREQVKSVGA